MASINISKKFDISGILFWKQPLRGAVKNGVLKILSKSLKDTCEGVPISTFNSFYIKPKIV